MDWNKIIKSSNNGQYKKANVNYTDICIMPVF